MYKYKKGDFVKIIIVDAFDFHSPIKIGSIHRIADIHLERSMNDCRDFSKIHIFLETEHPTSGRPIHVEEHQIEPYVHELEKGDYVRIISDENLKHLPHVKIGSVHRIHQNTSETYNQEKAIQLTTMRGKNARVVVKHEQVEYCEAPEKPKAPFFLGDHVQVICEMPNRACVGTNLTLVEYVRHSKIDDEEINVYIGVDSDERRYEVYEHCLMLVKRPEKKYKKGDRVVIIKDSDEHGFPVGSIQTITEMGRIHTTNGKDHYCLYEVGRMTVRDSDFALASESPYEVSMKEFEELRDKAIKSNEPVITSIQVKKNHVEETQSDLLLLC